MSSFCSLIWLRSVSVILFFVLTLASASAEVTKQRHSLEIQLWEDSAIITAALPPISAMEETLSPSLKSLLLLNTGKKMYIGIELGIRPTGHISYCERYEEDCTPNNLPPEQIVFTKEKLIELQQIILTINKNVSAARDEDIYNLEEWWDYPTDRGDCEDIALETRVRLMKKGWPRSALLLTYTQVKPKTIGNIDVSDLWVGHLVLTIRSQSGDLIVDNLSTVVTTWNKKTNMQFFSRQSPDNPTTWQRIIDVRQFQEEK